MIGASPRRTTGAGELVGLATIGMRTLALLGVPKVAFICGCGHTGTTLVATILHEHPEFYVPLRESRAFIMAWHRRFRRLLRLRRETLAAGKRYLVEKTPMHILYLDLIRRTIPDAKFVIMVRDGRDVTASLGRRNKGDFEAGLSRWVNDTGISLAQRGRADAHVQRYEDLVADPSATMQRICEFLGVPYVGEMLSYHHQQHLWFGRKSVSQGTGIGQLQHDDLRNWQVNQPIFDARGRWKTDLPPDYVERFRHGRARELMDALGYAVD